MDAKTHRLIEALSEYLEYPPPGTPSKMIDSVNDLSEMIKSPMYGRESPGERAAREVAEETMPKDMLSVEKPEGEESESSLATS